MPGDSIPRTAVEITIVAPAAGHAILMASGNFIFLDPNTADTAYCSISPTTQQTNIISYVQERSAASEYYVPFAGVRAFTVPPGATTFRLLCQANASVSVYQASMSGLFIAGP